MIAATFTAMPKINEICNLIASLEMKTGDAELLRKMMFDFRVRHPVAYRETYANSRHGPCMDDNGNLGGAVLCRKA